jgi:hypothetical protein
MSKKFGFTLKPFQLPPNLDSAPIVAVAMQNRCMLIGQSNGDLTRYLPDEKESVKIKFVIPTVASSGIMGLVAAASQPATTTVKIDIASIFMAESAMHALISSANGETFYLSLESVTASPVSKLKGHVVTAACFLDQGDMIVGTQAGKLVLVSSDLTSVKTIAELPSGERVTDIAASGQSVFVSSEIGAYMMPISGGSLSLVWQSPLPSLSSQFRIHGDIGGAGESKFVSWLNGVCVVTTKLPISQNSSNPTLNTVIPHSVSTGNKPGQSPAPRGLFVTDFHYMLLFETSKLVLVSRIALGGPVASIQVSQSSRLAAELRGDVVVWSGHDRKLSSALLVNERVDSWKHWLKKRNYAKALTSTNVAAEKAYVLKHEADFLLETATEPERKKEAARKAASLYARALKEDSTFIESQFEEITSKLESYDRESVLEFVIARMDVTSDDSSREVVQMSVLFVYCIHVLVELLTEASSESERQRLTNSLTQFVSDKHTALDKECISAVFELLESVGLYAELVTVAELVGDLNTAVRIDLQLGRYEAIVKRLSVAPNSHATLDLILSLSPLLFRFCPQEFVGLVLKQSQPDVFLPSLAACGALGREHREQGVLLLKSWLARGHMKGVDTLLQLLCEMGDESAVCQLIEANHTYIDSAFALRSISHAKMKRAETVLLSVEGFHLVATQRAVAAGDFELAKSCASRSGSLGVRRKCWLAILDNVSDPSTVVEIMRESEVLEVSDILPIVASAKDEVKLASIKPEIDECIKQVQQEVEITKKEISSYQEALAQIRADITAKPNECILLSHSQKCDLCFRLVFSERFYAFNCGHCFHEECLKDALTKRLVGAKSENDKILKISSSCCLCGHNSLLMEQLFEPFVDPAIDAPAILAWAVSC